MPLNNIYLYGKLAAHVPGARFRCDFDTAAEAVSAINANYPGFYDLIRTMELNIVAGDTVVTGVDLSETEATRYNISTDLHIMPAVSGAGGNRGMKAVLGIALIAVSFGVGGIVAGGLGSTAAIGGTTLGITGTQMLVMGAGLVLQGLTKPPEMAKTGEQQTSTVYSGPLNTQELGSPVPYVAGQDVIVGGVVIHADLQIEQRM